MRIPIDRAMLIAAGGLLLAGTVLVANGTRFSDFVPLASSAPAVPVASEDVPITFGNPDFQQRSIAERSTQLLANKPNSGSWDMNTVNETGPNKGRYLFTVFETGQSGVQRHDLHTGVTDTIWQSPAPAGHIAFDPSFWTPWGTLMTAEEAWSGPGDAGYPLPYGRLFELKNPIEAPGILNPLTPLSNSGADFAHQNVIPRTSHEGIQFDKAGNMYFIDELNGGSIYKYTSAARFGRVMSGRADYFAAGRSFVLRVGDGNTPNATGAFTWVPFTDANGVTSVDGRNTTNLAAFKGTDYQRPEDMQIQEIHGREYLYVATTTTNEVYRLDLTNNTISVFANRNTIDLATSAAVGTALASPDNLAIDHDGNIYIVEDRNGGVDDDIWFARDLNKDGDLTDPGEGIGRWASNGTAGSEFSGLYFDPTNKRRAWVNIQHPASGNDRTIEITIPHDRHHGHGHDDEDDDRDDHDHDDDGHEGHRGRR